jgi:hypothetical protein
MGMLEPHRTRMNGYIFYMEIPVNWIVSGGVLLQLRRLLDRFAQGLESCGAQ